jgi:hypothetical protein
VASGETHGIGGKRLSSRLEPKPAPHTIRDGKPRQKTK